MAENVPAPLPELKLSTPELRDAELLDDLHEAMNLEPSS